MDMLDTLLLEMLDSIGERDSEWADIKRKQLFLLKERRVAIKALSHTLNLLAEEQDVNKIKDLIKQGNEQRELCDKLEKEYQELSHEQ